MSSPRTATRPATARARSTTRARSAARRNDTRRSGTHGAGRRRPPAGRPATRARRSPGAHGVARWWPALLVAAAVFAGVARGAEENPIAAATGTCTVPDGSVAVTAEQAMNAATIAQVGRDRGLPDRAVVIALATAQQESRLRNLDYGDRDSLGLFQQRPSQGWGTSEQVRDPVYAAGQFYDRLVTVPGWDAGRLTEVAQAVQRSAYPELYQQWEGMAQQLTAAVAADTLTCS
ncbi:hypothetical protein [Blastococcus saxobsidens]|uniref:Uncharacterized protein n=1 Tax=Blastococcus saxobsidens (strain DD2) TaxID=1146883 RepID=H6RUD3_BLASD|nr:hypothetical protein [Blastococcus saxobsidens]CCG01898.1 Conserved protein of unknown function [Blastococcus saxobsidens DD2]